MNRQEKVLTIKEITVVALTVALLSSTKLAMSWLPNIEITSFLVIVFTLCFGKLMYLSIPAFILIEGIIYGFNVWWIMYLYAWPVLVFVTRLLRKSDSFFTWAIVSAGFGLSFGLMCSFPYIFLGSINGTIANGIKTAALWWVAGIPWDIVHCIGNFIIMSVLYKPVMSVMVKMKKSYLGT